MTVTEFKARFEITKIKLVKPNKDTAWVANIIGANNNEITAWVTKKTPEDESGRPILNGNSQVTFREGTFYIGAFAEGIDSFEI